MHTYLILVLSCLAIFSEVTSVRFCRTDNECDSWDPLCISNQCYPHRSFRESCSFERQCQRQNSLGSCIRGVCDCRPGSKWLRSRCVVEGYCDFSIDCHSGSHCAAGKCVHGFKTWQIFLIVFTGCAAFFGTIGLLHCLKVKRRRRLDALLASRSNVRQEPTRISTVYSTLATPYPPTYSEPRPAPPPPYQATSRQKPEMGYAPPPYSVK